MSGAFCLLLFWWKLSQIRFYNCCNPWIVSNDLTVTSLVLFKVYKKLRESGFLFIQLWSIKPDRVYCNILRKILLQPDLWGSMMLGKWRVSEEKFLHKLYAKQVLRPKMAEAGGVKGMKMEIFSHKLWPLIMVFASNVFHMELVY